MAIEARSPIIAPKAKKRFCHSRVKSLEMPSNPVQSSPNLLHYQVFLLRQWQEQEASGDRPAVWRFILESPLTGARRGFANVQDLAAFLEEQVTAKRKTNPFLYTRPRRSR